MAAAVPTVLYGAALNPYYPPENYDDILYLGAARAIATRGSYEFAGSQVVDWPPAFSALLAIPMALGIDSLLVSKILIIACAALACVLALRLLDRARVRFALVTVIVMALLPNALLMGSRVMSEWPFIAASFAFLVALDRVHDGEPTKLAGPLGRALLAGALLATAALTRSVGVLLGLAVLVQIVSRFRSAAPGGRFRAIAPELVVGLVGALPVLAWRAHVMLAIRAGTAVSRYQRDASFLGHFDFIALPRTAGDLLLQASRGAGAAHVPLGVLDGLLLLLLIVIVVGLVMRWRDGAGRPSDAYFVMMVVLFTCLEWKFPRYLLPLAAFLISDLIGGAERIVRPLARLRHARIVGIAALSTWIFSLAALDAFVLARGNGKNHHGLSVLASPTPERFYAGYWRDLYVASRWTRDQPGAGNVGLVGPSDCRYVTLFSGRPCADALPWSRERFLVVVVQERHTLARPAARSQPARRERTFGSITVRELW